MSILNENWQEENLKKSKEVLKDHFERRKQERMLKEMDMGANIRLDDGLPSIESGLDRESERERNRFYDNMIWDIDDDDDDWGKTNGEETFF